ncbi:hypothetical protein L6452_05718 [Arctium lappa]|uniref:Uncharacterized protein n=1 Tax=Arctium lappa TaxID=4217 RepID=A0ACB9EHG7_ARCLA|nr:hypothetical protein L6452_05718 [Arctium lappa]
MSLAARSEPERISDRLEDPVSNAPLAFNSQGELSASSLVPRGEGPSNSEVGSQYTDTPLIDRDLSLVTEEVVTIIKNQIPLQLGRQVPSESLLRLLLEGSEKIKAASAFRSALWLLAIKSEVTFGRGESQSSTAYLLFQQFADTHWPETVSRLKSRQSSSLFTTIYGNSSLKAHRGTGLYSSS